MKAPTPNNSLQRITIVAAVVITLLALLFAPVAAEFKYPKARKADVVDDYHGTKVPDPYRWLEDPDSDETMKWVEAENALFESYIADEPSRDAIEKRLTELWDFTRYYLPARRGNYYFYEKNDGLQDQAVLYVQTSLDGEPRVLLDPNALSDDGTVALKEDKYFSHDGTLLAYALAKSGSDEVEVRVRDVATGKDHKDVLETKFVSVAWEKDKSGFYYNLIPRAKDGEAVTKSSIYYHKLGTPQSADKLVIEATTDAELGYFADPYGDGTYLLVYEVRGTDPRNGILYRKMSEKGGEMKRLFPVDVAKYEPIDNIGSTYYFVTDEGAPRGRVIAVDLENPDRSQWKEVVAEREEVIDFADIAYGNIVVAYMKDAHHRLLAFDTAGKLTREIELPTMGDVKEMDGTSNGNELFFLFRSFIYPTTVFVHDFKSDKTNVFGQPKLDFDASRYETKQVFYRSKDGTRVPMFVTHRKGLKLDGNNPAILYGYGGFNISLTPFFSVKRLVWLENGGVFCVANLRGGNEYGEEWHQAGMLERKQNVFDDFIAAGEWLIANKYTSKERLAIEGGSNGGLLVGACMLQRPDLFGAVLCHVPVTDMLRYHKFTVGRYWTPEYGNAEENPEHFKFMFEYSPLHNVEEGTAYPPTLITTADTDDRVVPAHAKKFAATLQAADKGTNPILIRIETKAGHGAGKPTSKMIQEASDVYAFLFKVFDMSAAMVGRN